MSEPMWCDGCRATGAVHCAHPDQCGNMLSATSAADQWKAWLDDLPLPFTFDPAIGRLQDFITALTVRLDVPQPNPATPAALAASPEVAALIQEAEARGMERACLAVSERSEWPEDDHGRTEQPELFARVIHAIRAEAAALKGE